MKYKYKKRIKTWGLHFNNKNEGPGVKVLLALS